MCAQKFRNQGAPRLTSTSSAVSAARIAFASCSRCRPDITAFADFPVPHWKRSRAPTPWNGSTKKSNAAPTSSGSSRTPPSYCGWPARCSSKPTMTGRSPTNATCPKPPWRCSRPTPNPTRTLHPQPHSRHSEKPQSLRRKARSTYTTPRGVTHQRLPDAVARQEITSGCAPSRRLRPAGSASRASMPSSSPTGHGRTVLGGQDDKAG
jgi:hypothetical protein